MPNTPNTPDFPAIWDNFVGDYPTIASNVQTMQAQMASNGNYLSPMSFKKSRTSKKEKPDMPIKPIVPKSGFTFGCDPEAFVFKGKTPVPAALAGIPGSKEEPYDVLGIGIQVDGMAAEFNIPPVDNFEDFDQNIQNAIDILHGFLPKGHSLKFIPSVKFSQKTWDETPDDCKVLGCSPDVDAWTGNVNPPPERVDTTCCAGGHLHIGWTENEDVTGLQHMLNCQDLVKQLDWMLGGWSATVDTDTKRRNSYGKMGACRYKEYGVEYRVLSNFWVPSKDLRLQVWNRMVQAVNTMANTYLPERIPMELHDMLKTAIDEGSVNKKILDYCKYPITSLNIGLLRF